MDSSLKGRRQLLHLWKAQNSICPVCDQKITELTGWHNHHIVWRSMGGLDVEANRVLLHLTCHQHVHSKGNRIKAGSGKGRPRGLSRVRGNVHARFLGGGATVTPPCYPTSHDSDLLLHVFPSRRVLPRVKRVAGTLV